MLNTTLFSFSLASFMSFSPFYSINKYGISRQAVFINNHFARSFSSLISVHSTTHHTKITNSIFSHTLDSAIKFSNDIPSTCYFEPNKPVGGQTIKGDNFEEEDHRPYFSGNCGDIIITGCIFDNCYSNNPGGSLYICQNCTAIIHNTIFNHSKTASTEGGAIFAAENQNGVSPNYDNGQMVSLDIQYSCFQNIIANSNLYGVAVFSAAKDNILFYASTVAFQDKSQGAQFDLQAQNVSSQYVNSTGANSNFCGGIEYRKATDGFFRFQTISDMTCMFAVSYTSIQIKTLELEISNIINVTLQRGTFDDENVYSGLVHIRNSALIIISNFSFIDNKMADTPFKKENDNREFTDYQRIISRGHAGGGQLQSMKVELIGCYFSCSFDYVFYTKSGDSMQTEYVDCHQNAGPDDLNDIEQLDLGECKGKVTAAPLTATEHFSNSAVFSYSGYFAQTSAFSKTIEFSETSEFSDSSEFSITKGFSESNDFTKTDAFSKTDEYSKSSMFTLSSDFSDSNDFTKSDNFGATNVFPKTNEFSNSFYFSNSEKFTKSLQFSETNDFTKTNEYSKSDYFSKSKMFSDSNDFTKTSQFQKTDDFTRSNYFTYSNEFLKTNDFTHSQKFSDSVEFTKTVGFSKTTYFSNSNEFSKTNGFTRSNYFTYSNEFSVSKEFSKTDGFSFSNKFSGSAEFLKTYDFTRSNYFTDSNKFSISKEFTFTDIFSGSIEFTKTDHFTKSNTFTASHSFTSSRSLYKEVTQSNTFSKSMEFSDSFHFTNSEIPIFIRGNLVNKDKPKAGLIAGAVVGSVAAAVIIALIVFFIVRKKRNPIIEEEIETINEPGDIINSANPLFDKDAEDDPFKDDFQ